MTKDKDIVFLEHIMKEIVKIEKTMKGITLAAFKKNIDTQDAMIRRIEVIGEASKGISEELKAKHPEIEWKKIAGARNVLIHAYFSVDIKLMWKIAIRDIPKLKKQIRNILSDIEKIGW